MRKLGSGGVFPPEVPGLGKDAALWGVKVDGGAGQRSRPSALSLDLAHSSQLRSGFGLLARAALLGLRLQLWLVMGFKQMLDLHELLKLT